MKEIQITFDITGDVKVKMLGFSGKTCRDASVFIEQALGKVKSVQRRPEYYQAKTESQIKQQNG